MNLDYWKKRVRDQGRQAIVTPKTDYKLRTDEEIHFLVGVIQRYFQWPVTRSIEFGAGHGRLGMVQAFTSNRPEFLDFVPENARLFGETLKRRLDNLEESEENPAYPQKLIKAPFYCKAISEFTAKAAYGYAMTWTCLQHIVNDLEFDKSVKRIIASVGIGGMFFIYESTNDARVRLGNHMGDRTEEDFLRPFLIRCKLKESVPFLSKYSGLGPECPPHKLYIMERIK